PMPGGAPTYPTPSGGPESPTPDGTVTPTPPTPPAPPSPSSPSTGPAPSGGETAVLPPGGARAPESERAPGIEDVTDADVPYNDTCPVLLGNKVDPRFKTKWNGKVVGFCCPMC